MERCLFSLSIDLKHEVISPFVVGKSRWQFIGYPCYLPIDVALLSDLVDIVRDKPVVALYVELRGVEVGEPFGETDTKHCADYFRIVSVGFRGVLGELALEAG